jgi:hypothetical protein
MQAAGRLRGRAARPHAGVRNLRRRRRPSRHAARHATRRTARPAPGQRPASADAILADEHLPHCLRQLADSRSHHLALRITPTGWSALASLGLAGGLSRDGCIGVLALLRAAAVRTSHTQATHLAAGYDGDDPRQEATAHVSKAPPMVHEPARPKYPPR